MIRSVDNLPSLLRGLSQNGLLLALLGLGFLLVLPLPTPLLSLLLVADLLLSALVLSALVRARSAAQVTTLPTLLLLGALFRLALNIASSRLILTRGDAGVVVESVGRLLTDGSWAVGLLLYAMVSLVQWMVINQGSARVAEVAARFALDALPVRMLAIDQEAKAGRLDTAELDRRRTALLDEANWQGAMDGAIRFVRGDALVGLLIALINLVAGTLLGLMRDGESFAVAMDQYTTLAIGEGLVSQIPSLLLSTGAAIAVTRVGASPSASGLSVQMLREFAEGPRQLVGAGVWVAAFGLVPGLPAWPFVTVGALVAGVGGLAMRSGWRDAASAPLEAATITLAPPEFELCRSAGLAASTLAERVRLAWGLLPPPLLVVQGESGSSDSTVVWRGAQVARWRSEVGQPEEVVERIVSRAHLLCGRTLTEPRAAAAIAATGRALPTAVSLTLATQALRLCLAEGVSIAQMGRLLDGWEAAGPAALTARQLAEIAREVCLPERLLALASDGQLPALLVTPSVEQELRGALKLGSLGDDGELPQAIRDAVEAAIAGPVVGAARCFVVAQDVRWLFARVAARRHPAVPVFGHREVRHAGVEVAVVGRVAVR
jgi:flagellar biosynthesis component FlhA